MQPPNHEATTSRTKAPATYCGAGCYVHLPFCDRICPYCDFAVLRFAKPKLRRYLDALHAEIEQSPQGDVTTVYFGGGTPSTLEPDELGALLRHLERHFGFASDALEVTMESNPSRGESHRLRGYRRAGVSRLSIGVQSFDDGELHRLGREHDAKEAEAFVASARTAGFSNVSLDLIAGGPGQTRASFARSLSTALRCAPDHVSVYGLTIEAGTPYAAWHARQPEAFCDDDAIAQLLELADERLTAAGFEHYEISNFARPGFRCEHNAGYWRQRQCVALGMSAVGYHDGVRYRNARGFDAYCEAIESGHTARVEEERLSPNARLGEAAMLALRTAEGIIYDDFRQRFRLDAGDAFAKPREKFSRLGLLESDTDGMRLTGRGRLLANSVCMEFLTPDPEVVPS